MKKTIKITEQDIKNIIQKIINEQEFETIDNPLSKIKPSKHRETLSTKESPNPYENKWNINNGSQQPNNDLLQKKIKVRVTFKKLVYFLNDLIVSSGVNPETNNLVADVEKVQEKFENLWGSPNPNAEDDE